MRLAALLVLLACQFIYPGHAKDAPQRAEAADRSDTTGLPVELPIIEVPGVSETAGTNPALDILFPSDGAVYTSANTLEVAAAVLLPLEEIKDDVRIDITVSDEKEAVLVYSRTTSVEDFALDVTTHLPLSGYPPGERVITVYVQAAGIELQDAVTITVAEPAGIELAPVSLEPEDGKVLATFKAEISGPEDGGPFRYAWSIGQGGPVVITTEPVLQYRLPLAALFYDVTLDVLGDNGSRGDQTFEFQIGNDDLILLQDGKVPKEKPPKPAETCGCKQMTIKTKGKSGLFCAKPQGPGKMSREDYVLCAKIKPPKKNPCGPGETVYQCPLGRLAPTFAAPMILGHKTFEQSKLSFGFEVEAILTPKSSAKVCKEGQFVQDSSNVAGFPLPKGKSKLKPDVDKDGTITLQGKKKKVKITVLPGGKTVPSFGDKSFGRDNYSKRWDQKRYHGNEKITWFDRPRTGSLAIKVDRNGFVTVASPINVKQEFIAYVSGSKGTCWCRFTLDNKYDKTNGGITGAGITASKAMPNGMNCTIK
ncbi:hypothetical protein [Roseibium sp.]|uniref:hypothetical protein n=1 Tax=Roseibium sp. TaxID=1936156 RepID=UPI003D12841F